jgi:hypothetical protein
LHITFTTLALNQTKYFVEICKELSKYGVSTSIISFHEPSLEYIKINGIRCFNVFDISRKLSTVISGTTFGEILEEFQIDCPNILLSHEKVTFNVTDTQSLKDKLVKYFKSLDMIFSGLKKEFGSDIKLFQEVGGFTSLVSSYYVARKFDIDNIFMEPSFYKGRLFFVKNSFESFKIQESNNIPTEEVLSYLKSVIEKKAIVIPKKDITHYSHPILKILSVYNIRRFFEKLSSKYLKGEEEEFNYLLSFTFRHIRMLFNRIIFTFYYSDIPKGNFIYYPFHVPMDVALTVRAPEYVDQYALIDLLARSIPTDFKLVIKEHPAMIGVISRTRIIDLLHRHDNLILLKPEINNYEVMENMGLLVTINSKTGAESLLKGKKVLCLGDAFYNQISLVKFKNGVHGLYKDINQILMSPPPDIKTTHSFFQEVWNKSCPGELYHCSEENIKETTTSILNYLKIQ